MLCCEGGGCGGGGCGCGCGGGSWDRDFGGVGGCGSFGGSGDDSLRKVGDKRQEKGTREAPQHSYLTPLSIQTSPIPSSIQKS